MKNLQVLIFFKRFNFHLFLIDVQSSSVNSLV